MALFLTIFAIFGLVILVFVVYSLYYQDTLIKTYKIPLFLGFHLDISTVKKREVIFKIKKDNAT